MNSDKLSDRLEKVAGFVPDRARLADIGSDHAYLPSYLAKNGKIEYAIAGEVVKGPFKSAQHEIAVEGLTHMVEARLGNGLEVIDLADKIDTITICGMGGVLICDILSAGNDTGKLTNKPRLILQPNVVEARVREWLVNHQYEIVAEAIVTENNKFYEIIVADYNDQPQLLTDQDIQFGKFTKASDPEVFKLKWTSVLDRITPVIKNLQASPDNSTKLQEFEQLQAEINKQLEA